MADSLFLFRSASLVAWAPLPRPQEEVVNILAIFSRSGEESKGLKIMNVAMMEARRQVIWLGREEDESRVENFFLSPPLLCPTTTSIGNRGVTTCHVSHLLLQLPRPESWARESRRTRHNEEKLDGLQFSIDGMASRRDPS